MLTRKGQGRAELLSKSEGHGRGEDSGDAASKNSPAYGERNVGKAGSATREISRGRKPTSFDTSGIYEAPQLECSPERMTKRTLALLILLLVAVIPGTAHAGANAAAIVRSLIQPKRTIHESTRGTPVSWSFRTNGTFRASALTGLASWGATGEWKELPDGSILLEGTQTNARKPGEKPTAFRRVIRSVEILETRDDLDICLFTYEEVQKESPEGKSANQGPEDTARKLVDPQR